MKRLSDLRLWLSACISTWKTFNGADGDINFFSDLIQDGEAAQAYESIKASFDKLAELQQTLTKLYTSCKENVAIVSLFLL